MIIGSVPPTSNSASARMCSGSKRGTRKDVPMKTGIGYGNSGLNDLRLQGKDRGHGLTDYDHLKREP